MWGGWFGGYSDPSDYAQAEMPDWVNVGATLLVAAFILPFIAFLLVLPGVREKRIVTFLVFSLVLLTGASLSVSLYYPSWTVGHSRVVVPLRAHTTERVLSAVGVNVGLTHVNISLKLEDLVYADQMFNVHLNRLYYNERFDISSVSSMNDALKAAYCRGLPYPMLSVLEYFSLNQDAFDWGRHYRQAGHYTHAAVWLALSFWIIANIFLLFLPHYFALAFMATGISSIIATLLYLIMSPSHLAIAFIGLSGTRNDLEMRLGWCFWIVLSIGIVSVVAGLTLEILQHFSLYTLSTFLDSSIDETVSLKRRFSQVPEISFSNSLEIMKHQQRKTAEHHDKSASSSGFESRSSYNHSLRSSLDSFDEIEHSPCVSPSTTLQPTDRPKPHKRLQVESVSPEETC